MNNNNLASLRPSHKPPCARRNHWPWHQPVLVAPKALVQYSAATWQLCHTLDTATCEAHLANLPRPTIKSILDQFTHAVHAWEPQGLQIAAQPTQWCHHWYGKYSHGRTYSAPAVDTCCPCSSTIPTPDLPPRSINTDTNHSVVAWVPCAPAIAGQLLL